MEFVSYGFSVMYGEDVRKLERMVKSVRDALYELFTFYSKKHESQTQNQNASSSSSVSSQSEVSFMSGISRESHDSRQIRRVGDRFQEHLARVQGWWKSNSPRFPILSQMAKDILAIPISTVASESAFSTGGRVLDPFRSSLTPRMVQVLSCTQDWIRTRRGWFSLEEKLKELEQIEDEFSSVDCSILDEGNIIDEADT